MRSIAAMNGSSFELRPAITGSMKYGPNLQGRARATSEGGRGRRQLLSPCALTPPQLPIPPQTGPD